ncbi:MAG: uncharacterized protein JWP97_5591 [Labilithrix sp.]|nr:uncharacterized protein [Labilithrix sp.]
MRRSLLPALSVLAASFGARELRRVLASPPLYAVERRIGALELRRYRTRSVASTSVDRPLVASLQEGYARLATILPHGPPFTTTPAVDGEGEGGFVVTIEIPDREERSAQPRVQYDTLPERRVAALRFRGAVGVGRVRLMRDRLLDRVKELGLEGSGPTTFATYEAPTALPVLRRNEVWVELPD